MGFFRALNNQKESARYTVKTQVDIYREMHDKNPDMEPHELLAAVYRSYVKMRRVFPEASETDIAHKSMVDTVVLAAIPGDNERALALGLYLLIVGQHVDGGQLRAYPNFQQEFDSLTSKFGDMFNDNRDEFWTHYEVINPKTYREVFKE